LQEIRIDPTIHSQNIYTEGANMSRSKHMRRHERFLSLAQIDKLYHELNGNMLIKRADWAFTDRNKHA